MLSEALQRNAKHEAKLSNISDSRRGNSIKKQLTILRSAQNDISETVAAVDSVAR
jgi:hypothetical protein